MEPEMSEEWVKLKPRRSKNLKLAAKGQALDSNLTAVHKRLNEIRFDLKSSSYFTVACMTLNKIIEKKNLTTIPQIVCFGLGSFMNCRIALTQLAFLLELKEILSSIQIIAYDPIFSHQEKVFLRKLGISLLTYNCEGKYSIKVPTLAFLPHCSKKLLNNFLWKNWNICNLSKIFLVSNSFEQIKCNTPQRLLVKDANYIAKSIGFVSECELVNSYRHSDVFNDTSLHVFFDYELNSLESKFWLDRAEPEDNGEDPDFIRRTTSKKTNDC